MLDEDAALPYPRLPPLHLIVFVMDVAWHLAHSSVGRELWTSESTVSSLGFSHSAR